MPSIRITAGKIDTDKKRELAKGLTKVAAGVYGIPEDKFVVIIEEHCRENIATGGVLLADR